MGSTLVANIRQSWRSFKNIRTLTGASMLTALGVILHNFTIFITNTLRLGFTFLADGTIAYLYGPVVAAFAGGVADILKYLLRSDGGFFPGFTLNAMLAGFIYGLILYKKPVSYWRCVLAKLSVTTVVNLVLTPLWLSILYGNSANLLVWARIVKNLAMLPVEAALLYFLFKMLEKMKPAIS